MNAMLSAILTACALVLLSTGYAAAGVPPTPVPEPTSLALIAAGAAAIAWAKFRRRG
jgi:hypothetical protein